MSRLNRIGRNVEHINPFGLLLTVHDTQSFIGSNSVPRYLANYFHYHVRWGVCGLLEASWFLDSSEIRRLLQSFSRWMLSQFLDPQGLNSKLENETWLDFANLQYDAGQACTASFSNPFVVHHFSGKPVAATEVVWEGGGKLNGNQVRRGAWGILMASGFFLYGEFNVSGTGVGDFGLGAAHPFLKIMFDFMESVPYWTMSPHNELVNAGEFCLANRGKEYVVYAEQGGPISVDLSDASGDLQVTWLNPRTGENIAAGKVGGGIKQNFINPASDRNDWVLHIKHTAAEAKA
jgi:hypothetical protein